MADSYNPIGTSAQGFADISAFVADANAINAATKTALNTALTNISNLLGTGTGTAGGGRPDFNKVQPAMRSKLQNEIAALQAAITAHA